MILTIARREAAALFRSPAAWIVLAAVQVLVGFIFLLHLETYLQVQPRLAAQAGGPGVTAFLVPRLFGAATTIYVMALPLVTMGLLAGERRNGTLALLLSAPVSTVEIVLGKFLGALALLVAMVLLTALMPASLALVTAVDGGALALATLGAMLFVTAAGAAGLYLSSLTRRPAIAAIATLGLLLILLLLGEWGRSAGGAWEDLLVYPAPSTHLGPFFEGLLDSGAVAFFALFAGLFLALATRRLDNERLQR